MFRRGIPSVSFAAIASFRSYATRYFTDTHEWVEIDGTNATVGITDHAQEALGDVVFVGLPSVNDAFEAKAAFGEVESVKATNDIYSPVSGTVVDTNAKIKDDPSLVNKSAETDGWLIKLSNVKAPEGLMSREAYDKFLSEHGDH
eukprot:GILI01023221.1.p1 GENE.GILI01023221.1~~GILI01023221.1.p1  ORF type:complete len:156 (-),score=49.82 GILI01023221.1:156-590(-)